MYIVHTFKCNTIINILNTCSMYMIHVRTTYMLYMYHMTSHMSNVCTVATCATVTVHDAYF